MVGPNTTFQVFDPCYNPSSPCNDHLTIPSKETTPIEEATFTFKLCGAFCGHEQLFPKMNGKKCAERTQEEGELLSLFGSDVLQPPIIPSKRSWEVPHPDSIKQNMQKKKSWIWSLPTVGMISKKALWHLNEDIYFEKDGVNYNFRLSKIEANNQEYPYASISFAKRLPRQIKIEKIQIFN